MLHLVFKDTQSTVPMEVNMTPWDLYLTYRFAKDGMTQSKVKVRMGGVHHREVFMDVAQIDPVQTFTASTLDSFEDTYAERGILVW